MLRALLIKDLRRVRRNPIPWLVSLLVPFIITALIGWIFAPRGGERSAGLGTIRIAIVDEDDTALTEFLRGSLEQMRAGGNAGKQPPFDLRAEFLTREQAGLRIREDEIAAAVVIPAGFTDGYLDAQGPVTLRLIKNPARGIHPRIVEEMLGVLVTGLNAFRELAGEQLADVRAIVEDNDDDALTKLALAGGLMVEARRRLDPVRDYIAPPLVTFSEKTRQDPAAETATQPGFNIFGFVLAGMAAMFLLYLADNAMRDLYRESRLHTLERFKTLREGLLVFIASKVIFAIVMVLLGAAILLGLGGLIFSIEWRAPGPTLAMVFAYAFCAAGLLGLFAALAGKERRADTLGNLGIMAMALVGGCMFPPEQFPAVMREYLTPLMPPGWFATALRALQQDGNASVWIPAVVKFALVGLVAMLIATALFRRRMEKGLKA